MANPINEDVIKDVIRAYTEDGLTAYQIHLKYPIGESTIREYLEKAGVYEPAIINPPPSQDDIDEIIRLHTIEGLTVRQIHKKLGKPSENTMKKYLEKAGVYNPAIVNLPLSQNVINEIIRLYTEEGLKLNQISKVPGMPSDVTIRKYLKQYNYAQALRIEDAFDTIIAHLLLQKEWNDFPAIMRTRIVAEDLGIGTGIVEEILKQIQQVRIIKGTPIAKMIDRTKETEAICFHLDSEHEKLNLKQEGYTRTMDIVDLFDTVIWHLLAAIQKGKHLHGALSMNQQIETITKKFGISKDIVEASVRRLKAKQTAERGQASIKDKTVKSNNNDETDSADEAAR